MGISDRLFGTTENRAEYKAAKQQLADVPAADSESDEYLAANDRVVKAEKNIPWTGRG